MLGIIEVLRGPVRLDRPPGRDHLQPAPSFPDRAAARLFGSASFVRPDSRGNAARSLGRVRLDRRLRNGQCLFALSTYAVLSTGVLSFTTVVFAAVGGFLAAQMVRQVRSAAAGRGPSSRRSPAGSRPRSSRRPFLKLESHWMALASLALVLITRVVALNAPVLTGA
jgi:hypothetical protein